MVGTDKNTQSYSMQQFIVISLTLFLQLQTNGDLESLGKQLCVKESINDF